MSRYLKIILISGIVAGVIVGGVCLNEFGIWVAIILGIFFGLAIGSTFASTDFFRINRLTKNKYIKQFSLTGIPFGLYVGILMSLEFGLGVGLFFGLCGGLLWGFFFCGLLWALLQAKMP